MKKVLVLIFLFLIATSAIAQKYCPCENTRIGKLVTKPIMHNGKADYSFAVTSMDDKRNLENGRTFRSDNDSTHETIVDRIIECNKDTVLNLQFRYYSNTGECYYQLAICFPERPLDLIVLNGKGEIRQHFGDQNEVNALLERYFK